MALGLGVCHRTVEECGKMVGAIASEAFRKRIGARVPVLGLAVEAINHGRCHSSGLNMVLQNSFDKQADDKIFGNHMTGKRGDL
jgi:hypothetical protein